MIERDLNVENIAVESLRPYSGNARQHSKRQIQQIARSIERFGFTNPVLVSDDHQVLAGHGRVAAAKLLGMKTVPTVRLSYMTAAERRAYVLADNKLALNSGWDRDMLAIELQGLIDLNFDVEVTGFSLAEVDIVLEEAAESSPDTPSGPEDEIPRVEDRAVTRAGDLWMVGRHKVLCGDAREESDYAKLLNDETVDLIFTDPPYNVPIDGNVWIRPGPPPRIRYGRGRNVVPRVHRLFVADPLGRRRALPRRRDRLHVYGLATHGGIVGCRQRSLF